MPAELTASDGRHTSTRWIVRDVAVVVVSAAVLGALCGVLWEMWWTPPSGVVVDHAWYPDLEGVRQQFDGTSLYAVIALAGGVLLGAVCAWLFDRVELVTLASVAVGSVLAAWLMFEVGTALAPPDPAAAASTAPNRTALPGTLVVEGSGAFAAFPAGALTGLAIVFIGLAPTRPMRG